MALISTMPLLIFMLVSTLLGVVVGVCLWHWRLTARHDRELRRLRDTRERDRRAFGTMLARGRERAVRNNELQARRMHAASERAAAHGEALVEDVREHKRQVEKLENEVRALELQLDHLDDDLAEGEPARSHAALRATIVRLGNERRLERRLRAGRCPPRAATRGALLERRIPRLVESEWPGVPDRPAFERLDPSGRPGGPPGGPIDDRDD